MSCPDLASSCSDCLGLCCVATSFDRGPAFAFDKVAGEPCPHLTAAHRCAIHPTRAHHGMSGCLSYECHGAGQRASALPLAEDERVRTFLVLRELHELRWLLGRAARLCPASQAELGAQLAALLRLLEALPTERATLEPALHQHEPRARALLRQVGEALGGRAQWEAAQRTDADEPRALPSRRLPVAYGHRKRTR